MVDFMDGCYFLNSFEYFPEIYIFLTYKMHLHSTRPPKFSFLHTFSLKYKLLTSKLGQDMDEACFR